METTLGYLIGAILSAITLILLIDYIRTAPSF